MASGGPSAAELALLRMQASEGWALTRRALLADAYRRTHKIAEAHDLVQRACMGVIDQMGPAWDPRTDPGLKKRLAERVHTLWTGELESHRVRRGSEELSDELLAVRADVKARNPEELYLAREEEILYRRFLTETRTRASADPCVLLLLDGIRQDHPKPSALALDAGFTGDEVRSARERMARYAYAAKAATEASTRSVILSEAKAPTR